MTNKNLTIGLLITLVIAIGGYMYPHVKTLLGTAVDCNSNTCFTSLGVTGTAQFDGDVIMTGAPTLSGGLTVSSGDLAVSSGVASVSSTGTTTLSLLSTSATKGICIPFNATSTNTLLNLTFAASSTAQTTVGVAPIIRYGACQ